MYCTVTLPIIILITFTVFSYSKSTTSKIGWAVRLFKEWITSRNERALNPEHNISPIKVTLEEMTVDELNYCVSRFLCEVNKNNGKEYPGDTLHELVICLQMHIDSFYPDRGYKFLSDSRFTQIHNTLDHEMKERARAGLGLVKRQAMVITPDEEEMLWTNGSLGGDDPHKLLRTLCYLVGLNFALRGGQEHRNLRFGRTSQLKVITPSSGPRYLNYTEDISKCNQGGLKHRRIVGEVCTSVRKPHQPRQVNCSYLWEIYISVS